MLTVTLTTGFRFPSGFLFPQIPGNPKNMKHLNEQNHELLILSALSICHRLRSSFMFRCDNVSHNIIGIYMIRGAAPCRAGRGDVIVKAKGTLEEALDKVLPATQKVAEQLRSTGSRPDEIAVTFGIKLSPTAGAVIAWASGEATCNVTVRWTEKKEAAIP